MKAEEIIKHFSGFLWEAIYEIEPDYYVKPDIKPTITEVVLGPMNDLEKVLFSVKFSLFTNLLPFFKVNEDDDSEIDDFYNWLISCTQNDYLDEYLKVIDNEDAIKLEQETVLILRTQFLAAHDFLEIITSQRFNLHPEDVIISYRKGDLVVITNIRLVTINEN